MTVSGMGCLQRSFTTTTNKEGDPSFEGLLVTVDQDQAAPLDLSEVTDAIRIDLLDEAPPLNAEDSRFSVSLANQQVIRNGTLNNSAFRRLFQEICSWLGTCRRFQEEKEEGGRQTGKIARNYVPEAVFFPGSTNFRSGRSVSEP